MEKRRPKNYYELLQISESASSEMVRHAHHLLVENAKPYLRSERHAQAELRIESLDRALSILQDPERRAYYDAWLQMRRDKNSKKMNI